MGKYDLVIFDFHRTLTDSVYFDHFDGETRNLISDLIFRPPNNAIWDTKWMSGELKYSDILDHLAAERDITIRLRKCFIIG
jgi:phosphoserine phosphatase